MVTARGAAKRIRGEIRKVAPPAAVRTVRKARTAVAQRRESAMAGPRPAELTTCPPLFVGVTRFSLYDTKSRSWKLTRNHAADADFYLNQLYSAERMDPRCDIFLELSVPILQQMADNHDYRHIVRYSKEMPQEYQDRLQAAAQKYPVLLLVEGTSKTIVDETITDLAKRPGQDRTVVRFRLDDDDLLAATYLDELAAFATASEYNRAVSLALGYAAGYRNGKVGTPHVVRRVFGAQGLAYIGDYVAATDTVRLPPDGDHTKVHHTRPAIVYSKEPAFLQFRHLGQDMVSDVEAAAESLDAGLERLPVADDLDAVFRLFPTLRDRG